MQHTIQHRQQEAGFTLVELSIVLVIIGLIVGGVLAGQDMIKAAEIRATVSQTEKYNTATNTFRDKYRVMPGDAGETAATNFGMNSAVGRATAATGGTDQDGLLECNATACGGIRDFGSETALFWNDLSWALLISEALQTATGAAAGGAAGNIVPGGAANDLDFFLPSAKVGKGNYFTVFSASGKNFYQLAGITQITAAAGVYSLEARLTPQEAFNIDAKMDDGKPMTGGVRALNVDDAAAAAATSLNNGVATMDTGVTPVDRTVTGTVGVCVEDGSNPGDGIADYDTATTDEANTPACMLRMMFN